MGYLTGSREIMVNMDQPAGIYFVKVTGDSNVEVKKIVIVR